MKFGNEVTGISDYIVSIEKIKNPHMLSFGFWYTIVSSHTLPNVAKVTPENSPPRSVRKEVISEIRFGLFSPRKEIIALELIFKFS